MPNDESKNPIDEKPVDSKKELENLIKTDEDVQKKLIKQCQAEYVLGKEHQENRLLTELSRLKLFNNQRKDADRVGDLSLFSIMQTFLAALYTNNMVAVFTGREEGDDDTSENLNSLAKFDYKLMKKHIVDYFWIWDTCFFGRGLISLEEFNRDERYQCPVPANIDSMTFIHDPDAISVNGMIHNDGGMRFGGMEQKIRAGSFSAKNGYFNYTDKEGEIDLTMDDEIDSLQKRAMEERDNAQGLTHLIEGLSTEDMGDNVMYPVLRWYTRFNGHKIGVTLADARTRIIKINVFGKDEKVDFPIIDRPLFPHSKSWSGTSIPDLVEDKQRHKSVLMNLAMDGVKLSTYPSTLYDEDRIKNKADLMKTRFNKFVGVKGVGDIRSAVQPMNKPEVRMDLVKMILDMLDNSAQIASAAPEMQQGQLSGEQRTLGELNLVQANVTKRHTLAGKVFSWSEEAFWMMYYQSYKTHFKDDIDEKVIRISGAWGNKWRSLTRENIILDRDPDVDIEVKDDVEATRARERILVQAFGQTLFLEPSANRRYFTKRLAKLNNFKHDEIERLLPPTPDELIAEEENEKLSRNELVPVNPNDNHIVHYEINNKAADTPAKEAHMAATRLAMKIQKQQPELFPQLAEQAAAGQPTDAAGIPATQAGGMGDLQPQVNLTQA